MINQKYKPRVLDDLCRKITVGHVGKMSSSYIEGGIPFLRSQNVHPFRIDLNDIKTISPSFHKKLIKSELLPNDVVVVRTGYPGTAAVIPMQLRIANCADLVVIRPNKDIDPWFLAAVFNSTWGQAHVAGNLVGAAQQHFNIGSAREMQIPLPPIEVQRTIGNIMKELTASIENNTRRITILEEMAQAIYREWFVHYRFPGHEKVKLVDSALGKIPEGWKDGRLASVCEVIPGFAFSSKDWRDTGIPVIKIKNITSDNQIDTNEVDCVNEELISPKMSKFILNDGAFLIAMTGATAGKIGKLRYRNRVLLNQRVARIEPTSSYRTYVWCVLSLKETQENLFRLADGAAQPNMSGSQIENYPLLIPSEDLCQEFSRTVQPLLDLSDSCYFKNLNLRQTRDLLLPKLISGQVDVEGSEIDHS